MADKLTEVVLFKGSNEDLARELIIENFDDLHNKLIQLLKSLNLETPEKDLELMFKELLKSNTFLNYYFYLTQNNPALALHYYKHHVWIFKEVIKLLSLIKKDIPDELKRGSVNVNIDKYEYLFVAVWEVLTNTISPDLNTEVILQQRNIVDLYSNVQVYIRSGGDYVEGDLKELEALLVNYLNDDINLQDFIANIEQLSIYSNKYVATLSSYARYVQGLKYQTPSDVIDLEVLKLTSLIKEDELVHKFFESKEPKLEDAVSLLKFYAENEKIGEVINIDQLALLYQRLEYHFRSGADYDSDDSTRRVNKVIHNLIEASKEFPQLLSFRQFANILNTAKDYWDYDIEHMSNPDLDMPVKGAMLYILIEDAKAHALPYGRNVESYKPFLDSMQFYMNDVLKMLSTITNNGIKFRAAQRIVTMLAQDVLFGDTLKEFLNVTLEGLINKNYSRFKEFLDDYTLENPIVKKWFEEKLEA